MSNDSERSSRDFPSTPWSLVARAADADPEVRHRAMSDLLRRYWSPLRTDLARRMRVGRSQADDLVQSFIASRILENDLLSAADPSRGKFRSFLTVALARFASNQVRDERAAKRRPTGGLATLEDDQTLSEAPAPDASLDRAWAVGVLMQATEAMRAECQRSNRHDLWGVFEGRVLSPALHGAEPAAYADLIDQFHFDSPSQACNVLATAKRMFHRCLRLVIGEYEQVGADIDGEIEDLHRILAGERAR
jgi:RNA polymerase sigma-70 factor (ECF subfamily)